MPEVLDIDGLQCKLKCFINTTILVVKNISSDLSHNAHLLFAIRLFLPSTI